MTMTILQARNDAACNDIIHASLIAFVYFHQIGCLLQSVFVLHTLAYLAQFVKAVLDFDFAENPLEKLTEDGEFKMDQSYEELQVVDPEAKFSLIVKQEQENRMMSEAKKSLIDTEIRLKVLRKHRA